MGKFVDVPGGTLAKGKNAVYPEEGPEAELHVDPFRIQIHEVTNGQFAAFVAATGYVTDAERGIAEGRPGAGSALFDGGRWTLVPGASWKAPAGPGSDLAGKENLPVIHVSLADAEAYARWAGGRIPSEEEWEHAARLGLPDPARDTSGAFEDDGTPRANTWQGIFPVANTVDDGFAGPAPAGCFPADRLGLYDMIGNVWEWTETPFAPGNNTIKGGSYLCADNFCRRYRPAARHPQEVDFSSNHIGFRIVKDAEAE
ncbi:formylglycine-generating enzyme family protein [Hyphomonas sp. WL0036]|nr:formylglycine-generating enzyme family protein [Hyphomonas sediminis]